MVKILRLVTFNTEHLKYRDLIEKFILVIICLWFHYVDACKHLEESKKETNNFA